MLMAMLIGAFLGFWIGGPLGLLVGGGLGYWLAQRLRRSAVGRLAEAQAQFLESTFAVMGCLCKADGQVTEEELDASRQLWDRLRLNEAQRAKARADFTRGKGPDFDLDAELAKVRQRVGGQPALRQVFLQVQLAAVAADGKLHPTEHEMILRVAKGLGCSEAEIAQIEAMLHGATPSAGKQAVSLEEAYRVLGVERDASDAEIKKAYRRLMSQNHPDKLAGKGLPESMREVAQQRTSEIGNAYERIRQARAA
ncbi:co-chaperone DjlA [Billgrantia azerbaijanica]|nr:co-chaperone DjlA [Halomonas azerbaijanica]